jgi:hypothetical protein
MRGARLLAAGAWICSAIAVLHVVVPILGPSGYRFFGAGERIAGAAGTGAAWLLDRSALPGRYVLFSFVALVTGLLFLAGALEGIRAPVPRRALSTGPGASVPQWRMR